MCMRSVVFASFTTAWNSACACSLRLRKQPVRVQALKLAYPFAKNVFPSRLQKISPLVKSNHFFVFQGDQETFETNKHAAATTGRPSSSRICAGSWYDADSWGSPSTATIWGMFGHFLQCLTRRGKEELHIWCNTKIKVFSRHLKPIIMCWCRAKKKQVTFSYADTGCFCHAGK